MTTVPSGAAGPGWPLPLVLDGVGLVREGRRLLDRLSFRLEAGRRTVVLGPNGAGKSLLLRLCHGLIAPSFGALRWATPDGVCPEGLRAFVFQKPVHLRRSAAANIDYALAVAGVPRRERPARVEAALRLAGLAERARQPARSLSGGEQQRLAFARAVALRPRVLFLDEPTSNLDPTATRDVEALIRALHADGVAVVMTTHDIGQARRQADDVVFLHKGRLVERGPAADFFAQPRSAEARAYLRGDLLL